MESAWIHRGMHPQVLPLESSPYKEEIEDSPVHGGNTNGRGHPVVYRLLRISSLRLHQIKCAIELRKRGCMDPLKITSLSSFTSCCGQGYMLYAWWLIQSLQYPKLENDILCFLMRRLRYRGCEGLAPSLISKWRRRVSLEIHWNSSGHEVLDSIDWLIMQLMQSRAVPSAVTKTLPYCIKSQLQPD